ncbi:MAG: heparinase II/III family protein, partial [Myxococcota bacterium]
MLAPMVRQLLQRARFLEPGEIPYRVRQQWVRASDRWWRPPHTPAGPSPRWPDRPAGELDLLGSGLDPRTAWAATRLQTASPADAAGWLARNPPGHGIGWASAMEVALRAVSVVRLATEAPGPGWLPALHAHAAWLARHPSRGTSANNHRVAELAALAFVARVAPDLPGARRWEAEARRELPETLRAQLHRDGSGVEQSTHYLAYDLEWAALARAAGVPDLDEPIGRAARFLAALADRSGWVTSLGDDDGGIVLAGGEDSVRSVLGACGVAMPGYRPDARATLLAPTAAAPWVHQLLASPSPRGRRVALLVALDRVDP